MALLHMLCSSMSVVVWSGVELPLAGKLLAGCIGNTLSVDPALLVWAVCLPSTTVPSYIVYQVGSFGIKGIVSGYKGYF